MRSVLVVTAFVLTTVVVSAQSQARTAAMTVSVRVEPSCVVDVQAPGRVRLMCGATTLSRARVSVDGYSAIPVPTLTDAPYERVFMVPAAEALLVSARRTLPSITTHTDDPVVVRIDF